MIDDDVNRPVLAAPSVQPRAGDALLHSLVDAGPDLTFGSVDVFRQRIVDLLDLHEVHVIVDLRSTRRLDAAGLGALVAARRRLRASQGCLHLIAGPVLLERLADSGLMRLFDLAPDPETAAEHRLSPVPAARPADPHRPARG